MPHRAWGPQKGPQKGPEGALRGLWCLEPHGSLARLAVTVRGGARGSHTFALTLQAPQPVTPALVQGPGRGVAPATATCDLSMGPPSPRPQFPHRNPRWANSLGKRAGRGREGTCPPRKAQPPRRTSPEPPASQPQAEVTPRSWAAVRVSTEPSKRPPEAGPGWAASSRAGSPVTGTSPPTTEAMGHAVPPVPHVLSLDPRPGPPILPWDPKVPQPAPQH